MLSGATTRPATAAPRPARRRLVRGATGTLAGLALLLTSAAPSPAVAAPAGAASVPAAAPAGDGVSGYVTSVYRDLFGRAPDAGGLTSWTAALRSGTPRAAVANAITSSAEYRSGLIAGSYDQYLDRTADAEGLRHWLQQMAQGSTTQSIEAGFVASPEFYLRAGNNDTAWVTRLYRTVLDRTPAATEVSGWTTQLRRGASRYDVALGFLLSTEHLGTVMDSQYRGLLGRGIDSAGRASWVAAIQRGHRLESVIGGVIASEEYFARAVHAAPAHQAPPAPARPPAVPAAAPAPSTPAPSTAAGGSSDDDTQTGDPASWDDLTSAGWSGKEEAATGRITSVRGGLIPGSGPLRPNDRALRFELRNGDITKTGTYLAPRSEVFGRQPAKLATSFSAWPDPAGSERWYRIRLYVPQGFPLASDTKWLTVTQWKGLHGGSPPVALEIKRDSFRLGGTRTNSGLIPGDGLLGRVVPGQWTEFVVGMGLSDDPHQGWVEVYRDGRSALPRTSVATMDTFRGGPDPVYLKQGIYRSTAWTVDHVLYSAPVEVSGAFLQPTG